MSNKILIPLILNYRKRDEEAFLKIFKIFERLINYYDSKMRCEDGGAELTLFLLELLFRLDLSQFKCDNSYSVQKYIVVAIRNRYIDISRKSCEDLKKIQLFANVNAVLWERCDERLMLEDALCKLSYKQRRVLEYKYFCGYNDFEIAKAMGITRQAVNGIKRRAFDTLKKLIKI